MEYLDIILKSQKKTQKDLAKFLETSPQVINNYVKGKSEPDIRTLVRMADYFSVSLDYLCGRQYNNQVGFIPEERKDLVKLVINLTDTKAERVYGYAKALSEQD